MRYVCPNWDDKDALVERARLEWCGVQEIEVLHGNAELALEIAKVWLPLSPAASESRQRPNIRSQKWSQVEIYKPGISELYQWRRSIRGTVYEMYALWHNNTHCCLHLLGCDASEDGGISWRFSNSPFSVANSRCPP